MSWERGLALPVPCTRYKDPRKRMGEKPQTPSMSLRTWPWAVNDSFHLPGTLPDIPGLCLGLTAWCGNVQLIVQACKHRPSQLRDKDSMRKMESKRRHVSQNDPFRSSDWTKSVLRDGGESLQVVPGSSVLFRKRAKISWEHFILLSHNRLCNLFSWVQVIVNEHSWRRDVEVQQSIRARDVGFVWRRYAGHLPPFVSIDRPKNSRFQPTHLACTAERG